MPWTLNGAVNQGAIRERSALVRAVVAERHHALAASGDHDAFVLDFREHYLSVAQLALIANRPVPAVERALFQFAGSSITAVHANLIAIG